MDQTLESLSQLADKIGTLVESTPQRAAESLPQNDLAQLTGLLQRIRHEHIDKFVDERENRNLNRDIASCRKGLEEYEASLERDRRTLEEETAKNTKRNAELKKALEEQKKASEGLKKADENLQRLLEEQKSEKEESLRKVNEIEGRLRKDRSEKVLGRNNVEMEKKLEDKQQEFDDLRQSYQQLISKERHVNNEIQEARKALIEGWVDVQSSSSPENIGIKRLGEIDEKEFTNVCKTRFPISLSSTRAVGLCSSWQKKLSNPEWHPFKTVEDEKGNHRSVINEDDESLRCLKKEWGCEIYSLVTTALMERQEYNAAANGCYPVLELWNYREKRKATTKEVIEDMVTQRKKPKLEKRK